MGVQFRKMIELENEIKIERAILAQVHGIEDLDAYIDLYRVDWFLVDELVPNQFALNLWHKEIALCEWEKEYWRKGGYEYDYEEDEEPLDFSPTSGEGWSFEGDVDSLNHWEDGEVFLFEGQEALEWAYDTHQAYLSQTGLYAPENPHNVRVR